MTHWDFGGKKKRPSAGFWEGCSEILRYSPTVGIMVHSLQLTANRKSRWKWAGPERKFHLPTIGIFRSVCCWVFGHWTFWSLCSKNYTPWNQEGCNRKKNQGWIWNVDHSQPQNLREVEFRWDASVESKRFQATSTITFSLTSSTNFPSTDVSNKLHRTKIIPIPKHSAAHRFLGCKGITDYHFPYGCFLKWWYPQNTPKWSFVVGKPHFRKPPYLKFVVTSPLYIPWTCMYTAKKIKIPQQNPPKSPGSNDLVPSQSFPQNTRPSNGPPPDTWNPLNRRSPWVEWPPGWRHDHDMCFVYLSLIPNFKNAGPS